jgi:2-methylcitrate dehydratase PrpD
MSRATYRESSTGATRSLSRFCSTLRFDDLDEITVESAEKALVDALASCYAGVSTEPGELMIEYASSVGGDDATIIGADGTSIPQFAALANGTTTHALDVDDGHRAASAHPGSAVVPAALAIAEQRDRSGTDLLTAIVAGYEAMITTASAVQPSHRERHFHATATAGCFGAAAAVACLLDLDETETAHALGLAGTQAGGLFEFLEKGSMAKRFHPGRAAMAGIVAAELAANGFDGPDTIIEGEGGFAEAFADEYDLSGFGRLGEPFAITQTYLKPYPACRHIHGPIDVMFELRSEGVEPGDVSRIVVETYQNAAYHDNAVIRNLLDAQMSIPFGVATALANGNAELAEFDPSLAADEEIASVIEKTEVVATAEMEAMYPDTRPAKIVLETTDGERYERLVEYPSGAAERPLSSERIAGKFRDLSDGILSADEQETILANAFGIADVDSLRAFATAL